MLGPEDVETLMTEQGLPTDEIEALRVFYNIQVKDKELSGVLSTLEKLVKEHFTKQAKRKNSVETPR